MCVFSFDDGMVAASWYAWLALRSRVSMSAIGSVIVMGVVLPLSPRFLVRWVSETWRWASRRSSKDLVPSRPSQARAEPLDEAMGLFRYQELLRTPGSSPAWAISRRQIRHRPNLRKTEWGRPHRWQRVYPRTANFGLRAALLIRAFLAMVVSPTGSADGGHDGLAGEGEAELAEQLAALVVVRGGGDQRDVHAARPVDLVDVDLAEHRLLVQAERVVAVAVELLGVQTAEVTDTGQGQRQQPVQELPHPVTAEGDLRADRHALAQLELRDGLAGPDHRRLLTGDGGQVADGAVHQLGVASGLTDAHVDDDLRQARDLHDVVVVELRLQRRRDRLAVVGEHAGQLAGGCAHGVQRSLPVRRETRMLRPLSSLR